MTNSGITCKNPDNYETAVFCGLNGEPCTHEPPTTQRRTNAANRLRNADTHLSHNLDDPSAWVEAEAAQGAARRIRAI